ncbi:MAG: cation:dicarboxylase symporter family transporter, partial [Mogibacterium sp.]|nr:cation:dicarboxylase symporter family transporter [Mogibacterium sp.]
MKKLSLPVQIFIALGLGIVAGLIFLAMGEGGVAFAVGYIKPIGTIFLNLLKFIVVPIVLTSIIQGVIS